MDLPDSSVPASYAVRVFVVAIAELGGSLDRLAQVASDLETTVYELKLTLSENALIVAVVKASMADIKEGTFLGSAAIPQPDGSQKALEVHIFPEQMRGTDEGHRPYAPVANSTMTNGTMTRSAINGSAMTNGATAGSTVAGVDGSSTIVVKYKDGEQKIVVPPNVPILRYEIGSKGDLKPGARFTVSAATKKADGTLEANRINVGREGVVPQ